MEEVKKLKNQLFICNSDLLIVNGICSVHAAKMPGKCIYFNDFNKNQLQARTEAGLFRTVKNLVGEP